MQSPATTILRIGTWRVNPTSGEISRDGETARLEARTMRLLLCLAEHAGEVVSIDDLLNQVWPGVAVSPDSVYQAIASLRRILGDDPKQPTYIATVPRLGYRMVATVSEFKDQPTSSPATTSPASTPHSHSRAFQLAGALICLALAAAFLMRAHRTAPPVVAPKTERSIAVLPFLDLTEGMHQGEFADGLTEELIDKLSKLPGFRVPSPTSSFYYRDKNLPVATIAKALGVVYVLDGSVRKSDDQVRVAARLVRADNGYVLWSETYDRPFHDLVMIQDDIAGEVAKTLGASTEFKTP